MPRQPRQESSSLIHHWITRGVNKKRIFHTPADYFCYLRLLSEYKKRFSIMIFHYCVMPNHCHVILSAKDITLLSQFSHYVQRSYAYYYQITHGWEGQVFQRSFKSYPIENDSYLLECGRYIERNPVRAKIVEKVGDYQYSSFSFYAYLKMEPLVDPSPAYLALSNSENKQPPTPYLMFTT